MTRAVDVSGRGVRVSGRSVGVGSAIPDSESLRYPIPDTTTPLNDSIGSNDGQLNGITSFLQDSNFVEGYKLDLGLDGYVISQNDATAIDDTSDWSVGITVDVPSSGLDTSDAAGGIIWLSYGAPGIVYGVAYDGTDSFVCFRYVSGGYDLMSSVSEPSAPYTIRLFTAYDDSADTFDIYKNAGSAGGSDSITSVVFGDRGRNEFVIGTTDDLASIQSNPIIDNPIIYDKIADKQDDYDIQPWS